MFAISGVEYLFPSKAISGELRQISYTDRVGVCVKIPTFTFIKINAGKVNFYSLIHI